MAGLRFFVLLIGPLLIFGCGPREDLRVLYGNAFGTTYTIKCYSDLESTELQSQVNRLVDQVNASISTYDPQSIISRINQGDTGVVADLYFKEVLSLSREVNKATFGFFDPTVGAIGNALGFGPQRFSNIPSDHVLDSLCQFVGLDLVSIRPKTDVVDKADGVYLDFNAIGKGYGIDVIGRHLEQIGITDYLVEVGGEIRAKGKNREKNKPWIIGIESPEVTQEGRSIDKVLAIQNQSLASSGNYRKFRLDTVSGRKFVHTINPLNCRAEQNAITSASVWASTCAEADAYATAIMAMGLERARNLIQERPELIVYYTYHDAQNQPKWYASPNLLAQFR